MLRICGKNQCIEGEDRGYPKGIITFSYLKPNGDHYAFCDYCRDYLLKNKFNENKGDRYSKDRNWEKWIVYFIYDKFENLLYIGKSEKGGERTDDHVKPTRKARTPLAHLDRVFLELKPELHHEGFASRDQLLDIELKAILEYKPLFNKEMRKIMLEDREKYNLKYSI